MPNITTTKHNVHTCPRQEYAASPATRAEPAYAESTRGNERANVRSADGRGSSSDESSALPVREKGSRSRTMPAARLPSEQAAAATPVRRAISSRSGIARNETEAPNINADFFAKSVQMFTCNHKINHTIKLVLASATINLCRSSTFSSG